MTRSGSGSSSDCCCLRLVLAEIHPAWRCRLRSHPRASALLSGALTEGWLGFRPLSSGDRSERHGRPETARTSQDKSLEGIGRHV